MRGWILSMLLLFSCGGSWGQASVETEMAKRTELDLVESSLTEEERAVSGDMALDGSYDTAGALHRLWARFLLMAKETAKNEFSFAWKLVLIAALAAALFGAFDKCGMIYNASLTLSPRSMSASWEYHIFPLKICIILHGCRLSD